MSILARAWWDEHVETAQYGNNMKFHYSLMKVANKIGKLVCIFSSTTLLNKRYPAWVSCGSGGLEKVSREKLARL